MIKFIDQLQADTNDHKKTIRQDKRSSWTRFILNKKLTFLKIRLELNHKVADDK